MVYLTMLFGVLMIRIWYGGGKGVIAGKGLEEHKTMIISSRCLLESQVCGVWARIIVFGSGQGLMVGSCINNNKSIRVC